MKYIFCVCFLQVCDCVLWISGCQELPSLFSMVVYLELSVI